MAFHSWWCWATTWSQETWIHDEKLYSYEWQESGMLNSLYLHPNKTHLYSPHTKSTLTWKKFQLYKFAFLCKTVFKCTCQNAWVKKPSWVKIWALLLKCLTSVTVKLFFVIWSVSSVPLCFFHSLTSRGCQLIKSIGRDVFDRFNPKYNWSAKEFELAKVWWATQPPMFLLSGAN